MMQVFKKLYVWMELNLMDVKSLLLYPTQVKVEDVVEDAVVAVEDSAAEDVTLVVEVVMAEDVTTETEATVEIEIMEDHVVEIEIMVIEVVVEAMEVKEENVNVIMEDHVIVANPIKLQAQLIVHQRRTYLLVSYDREEYSTRVPHISSVRILELSAFIMLRSYLSSCVSLEKVRIFTNLVAKRSLNNFEKLNKWYSNT